MHQQSLRILRWTEDDRPFTKVVSSFITAVMTLLTYFQDFHDLFCTLMISLPLTAHRVRLTKKPQSFTTGEAVAHLGNLRFTQSNRRPSPHDPNMWVTTKIATTFSMVPHMARYLCDKFLAARLIDSAEGKTGFAANAADAVWQLTSKGLCILQQFAHRNGVQERNVYEALDSPRNNVQLLVLERDPETDALTCDRATVDVIFRRFAGSEGGSSKPSSPHSDSDSANESLHVAGVKVLQRKVGGKVYPYTMTGKDVIDWLMTCCTLVDGGEAEVIARLFTSYGLLDLIQDDKCTAEARFPSTKNAVFHVTEEGQETARWISSRRPSRKPCTIRDSNASKMMLILTTPSMRLLFREFLRDTHCEENLTFYTEVNEFLQKWRRLEAKHGATGSVPIPCSSETLAGAYGKSTTNANNSLAN